ncbi:unnamed protein product [Durusdinium trenchii]|uniref:Pre-mRNA-splicing factor 38 n=1 Tax=Durusdinium trenchii TaxID=1381693 RepID=A0ABP0MI90_9DINO
MVSCFLSCFHSFAPKLSSSQKQPPTAGRRLGSMVATTQSQFHERLLHAAVASAWSIAAEEDPPLPGSPEYVGSDVARLAARPFSHSFLAPSQASSVPTGRTASAQRCHLHQRAHPGCQRCAEWKRHGSAETESFRHAKQRPHQEENPEREPMRGDEDWEQQLGFNTRLQSQIFQSDYFRSMQHHVTNVESLVEEILTHADHAESYTPNSNNTMPSTLLCCVCRLAQLQPSKDQLRDLVGFRAAARTGSAYVRAVALLHLRFNCPPTEAWRWLRNFLFDTEVFRPTGGPTSVPMSMGDWVEHLLTDDKYYDTVLPRLPLGLKREMALELVQLPELRQAYSKHRCRFDQHRLIGARVRVLRGTTWHYAQVLSSCVMGRSLVVDVQLEDGSQEEVPCGLVRLQEPRPRGSWQRSRSPKLQGSPRTEEKLREEYLRRDREKAVTEDKNDYFKPIPKLKKMLMTKDQSLRNVAPDRVGVTPVVKLLKEPREPKEVHREPREAPRGETSSRQLLLEVVQKYSSGSAARHDRLEYHDWHRAVNSGNEVLAPETIRLG